MESDMESDTDSTAIGYPARQTKITHFLSRSSGSNENVTEAPGPGPARKKSKHRSSGFDPSWTKEYPWLMKLLNLVWTLVCFVVYVESITCLARK